MNKKKLIIARKRIDKIDQKLFELIKKRTHIVNYMLSLKKNKKDIIDYKRINEILRRIKKKSLKINIDTKLTEKIWKSIIWSYIEYQRRRFKKK